MKQTTTVRVGKQEVEISNMAKVFYPQSGFTKGQMLDYYARVANWILPYIFDRPLTMARYPNGVEGPFFYEKQCPTYRPKWVQTAKVSRTGEKGSILYCTINDKATLIWTANLASIEVHVLLSKKGNVRCPTSLAFDLDPGPGTTLLDCAWAALELQKVLADFKLKCFAKTSGKKGLHVYVPLNNAHVTFNQTKEFAHATAQSLERRFPDKITSNMSKAARGNKIFIDWSQNDEHKTTCAVYSLRVAPQPTVSTPAGGMNSSTLSRRKIRAVFLLRPKMFYSV
jgi:bifunctional non-homologous end joining protein LigD